MRLHTVNTLRHDFVATNDRASAVVVPTSGVISGLWKTGVRLDFSENRV
jgi:hypothetical protein